MSTATLPDDPQLRERFSELKPPLSSQAAVIEANRCLNCFDAPCTSACPTHIDVPGFIKRIASGNLRGSALRILDANILGGSCSRACPVEVLCEGACVMHRYHREPIQIALLQRHAMDFFHDSGEALLDVTPEPRSLRVACIGQGPASLACAAELRRQGASVTIFERRALPGGLNTYGVAEYKLRATDSLREVEMIRRMGVEFRFEASIESGADLEAIEAEFDFVFLGVGLGAMQRLGIPGEELEGVMNALELISAYKTGHIREITGTVVVVGAGNTAIDAANAARRLGAEHCLLALSPWMKAISPPSISSMNMPSRRACSFCGAVSRLLFIRESTVACCSIRCWFNRWIERCCLFLIRNTDRVRPGCSGHRPVTALSAYAGIAPY
jgi:dihydropyrimidine dehydrogenase (NAD+) subunit PreT